MKSDDRSFSKQRCLTRLREILQKPQTFGRFEVEQISRRQWDVHKEYGTNEDKSFKLLNPPVMSLEYETKKDKSKKKEPRVNSGRVNMQELMYEVVAELPLDSLLERRSITSVLENPNPDSESSMSSCVSQSKKKRCSVKVEERRPKKGKVVSPLEVQPIQTTPPDWLLNVMRNENGYNPKLISTRELFKSDLDKGKARLQVPFNQVKTPDFLTEDETRIIHENAMKIRDDGVPVNLVDPRMNKHALELRKWKMKGNWNYVFVKGWNDVLDANKSNSFKEKDVFPLWSFRSGTGKLCFALTPKNSSNGSTSGESGSGGDGAST